MNPEFQTYEHIRSLVENAREEGLHLEFKTLPAGLTRDGIKVVAKAVSGFANAEGGTLIIGIDTRKSDGKDVAYSLAPVSDLVRVRNQLAAAVGEMLSPVLPGITVSCIRSDLDDESGFIIVQVPASNIRQHQNVKEQRYFRRGYDATRVLDHSEIRDLMMSHREGRLAVVVSVRADVSRGDNKIAAKLIFELENVGPIPIVAPYMRLSGHEVFQPASPAIEQRNSSRGRGFYCSRDTVLHLGDTIAIVMASTGLNAHDTTSPKNVVLQSIAESGDPASALIQPWGLMMSNDSREVLVDAEFVLGAENVQPTSFRYAPTKVDLMKTLARGLLPS